MARSRNGPTPRPCSPPTTRGRPLPPKRPRAATPRAGGARRAREGGRGGGRGGLRGHRPHGAAGHPPPPGAQAPPSRPPGSPLDRLVLAAAERDIRSTVLCSSLIYGHGYGISRDSVQIPRLVDQARRSGVVRHIGAGRNIWSTVHIDDVVALYLLALASAPAGSFYFVENGEASFAAMTGAIADALGLGPAQPWDIDSAIREWGYEPAVYALGSNSRVRGTGARGQLGWKPEHASVTDWIRGRLTANEPG
ncbi:NAD-dependent epimerase/dehydratase family protein [Streptomyces sp. NPDC059578]|uniref:NAD-dependent epimerase/dehydratase family protein n=1 Tax=Streptomyces sp. NPDC059578 TaxID=3346874 RepID=UPI0036C961F3